MCTDEIRAAAERIRTEGSGDDMEVDNVQITDDMIKAAQAKQSEGEDKGSEEVTSPPSQENNKPSVELTLEQQEGTIILVQLVLSN